MLVAQRHTPQYMLCRPSATSARHTAPTQRITPDDGGNAERNSTTKEPMDVNGNPVIGKSNGISELKPQQPPQRLQFARSNGPLSTDLRDICDDKFEEANAIHLASDNSLPRRKKKKEGPMPKAEELFPNNCGHKSVDYLLDFIESSDNASKRKPKEKSKTNQNSMPSGITSSKKVKKGRSSSLTESPKESEVGSEHGEDTSSRVSEGSELKDVSSEQTEVSSLNHKIPSSSAPISMAADEAPLADIDNYNDNYIFTDIDSAIISNEDEFKLVCKKKKQKSSSYVTSSSSSSLHREHYIEVSPDSSDLESVKSLPTGTSNDMFSACREQCSVISYAKIAAMPRQTNGINLMAPTLSSKAAGEERMASREEAQHHTPADVSPPVHHSPELPSLNDFPAFNNCDLQTSCRSISNAKTPTVSSQEKDLPAAANHVGPSSRNTTLICDGGDIFAKDNRYNKFDLEFVGESHIQPNEEGPFGGQSVNATACCNSGVENMLTCCDSELRPAVSHSVEMKASSNNCQFSVQNVLKPVENNHKKSTAYCVIFMDRPAQDGLVSTSPKIDFSFGFDPSESADKGKIIPRKANGLILPSPPQGSPGLTFLGPETDLVSDEPELEMALPAAAGEPAPVQPKPAVPTDSPSRDCLPAALAGLQPVTVPPHLYDPRNDCANFALENTVHFIRREWDRVAELAQKNPNKVIIYCCD